MTIVCSHYIHHFRIVPFEGFPIWSFNVLKIWYTICMVVVGYWSMKSCSIFSWTFITLKKDVMLKGWLKFALWMKKILRSDVLNFMEGIKLILYSHFCTIYTWINCKWKNFIIQSCFRHIFPIKQSIHGAMV